MSLIKKINAMLMRTMLQNLKAVCSSVSEYIKTEVSKLKKIKNEVLFAMAQSPVKRCFQKPHYYM